MKWEVSLAVAMIMLAVRAPSPGGGEETTAQLHLTALSRIRGSPLRTRP